MDSSEKIGGFKHWMDSQFNSPAFRWLAILLLLEWGYSQGKQFISGFAAGVKSVIGL